MEGRRPATSACSTGRIRGQERRGQRGEGRKLLPDGAQSKHGVTLERIYWTVGAHDLVAVLEAPDVESVSAFLLDLAAAGNVRSTTMQAFDRDEMVAILGRTG